MEADLAPVSKTDKKFPKAIKKVEKDNPKENKEKGESLLLLSFIIIVFYIF